MPKKRVEEDEAREYRINMEAIVDAYGPEEQAMGWFYYLEDKIHFPFEAECRVERTISPLKLGERVQVEAMASENDCMHEMFVQIELFGPLVWRAVGPASAHQCGC
jgi:hypothetical protein